MKMQVSTHALLAACLLLLGSRGADSQVLVCGAAGTALSAVGTTTCTCPAGTGEITAVVGASTPTTASVAVPSATGVLYLASAGTFTTATTITLVASGVNPAATAGQVAALCFDILPGYAAVPGSVQTTATISQVIQPCTTPGTYCLGTVDALKSTGISASAVLLTSTTFTSSFTVSAGGTGTAATCPAFSTGRATTALTSLAACTDLAPGYAFVASPSSQANTVIPATTASGCVAGAYCPGVQNVFIANPSITGLTPATPATDLILGSTTTTTGAYTLLSTGVSLLAITCPTGSTSVSPFSSCGSLAAGYYIASGTATTGAPSPCPAGSYCLGSNVESPSLVNGVLSVTATAAFGATACPTGTTNALTLAAQIPAATSSKAATSAAVCDDLAPGYYLTATVTGITGVIDTLTAAIAKCTATNYCPGYVGLFAMNAGTVVGGADFAWTTQAAPISIATGQFTPCTGGFGAVTFATSAATGCASIAAGQYLPAGSLTPTPCAAAAGSYCPGFSTATGVALAANAVSSNTATTASGVVSCPIYATGTATAQPSAALACTGLAAGYALLPGVTSTKLASLFQTCPTGVTCPAVPLFFGGAIDPVASNTGRDDDFNYYGVQCLASATYSATTSVCSTAMDILNTTDLTAAVTTLTTTGTLLGLVQAGYFIAPNGYTPAVCPTGSVCAGGDYLGDAIGAVVGVPAPCPVGTTVSVVATQGANTGCILNLNFYTPTASTVSLCPANNYCPGGGFLGIAGGAFPCTANSTIALCNDFLDNIQSSSYAAGATTVAAASAPAVTVSPAAVTVTPAPITVTPAPITVTTAPVTVTPAPITVNVPAPVSAASTRSSALVLVLAALVALAAF